MQRSSISYMYSYSHAHQGDETEGNGTYNPEEDTKHHVRIALNMSHEQFNQLTGDPYTILYAFMVLFTGSMSDLLDRKKLLLGTCFGWCVCTFLSGMVTTYEQMLFLRLLGALFNAVSGPCSYSLITDWIPPESRTLAYSIFAFGV